MSYSNVIGGKLQLKKPAAPAASSASAHRPPAPLAGSKRPRDAGHAASAAAAAAASAAPLLPLAAAAAREAQRLAGRGTVVASGTTVHGTGTTFLADIGIGDAIEVVRGAQLGGVSASVSHPFSSR